MALQALPEGPALFRLIIVRHGETTANAAGIIQGQSLDPSFKLTPLGVLQARAVGKALAGKPWWKLVSSDLPRTRETMALILAPDQEGLVPKEGSPATSAAEVDGGEVGSKRFKRGASMLPPVEFSPLLRESFAGLREGQPKGCSEKQLRAEFLQRQRQKHKEEEEEEEEEEASSGNKGSSSHQSEPLPRPLLPPIPETREAVAARGAAFVQQLAVEALAVEMAGVVGSPAAVSAGAESSAEAASDVHAVGIAPLREALLVSHGGFIRTFLRGVCGLASVETINNSSVTVVDVRLRQRQPPAAAAAAEAVARSVKAAAGVCPSEESAKEEEVASSSSSSIEEFTFTAVKVNDTRHLEAAAGAEEKGSGVTGGGEGRRQTGAVKSLMSSSTW